MKWFIMLMVLITSDKLLSQENNTFIIDSVKVNFNIIDNIKIKEEITVINLSNETVYLPIIENKELFFFSLGNRLYSYFGIMSSMVGPPNLGGEIKLKILKPKEKFEMSTSIDPKGKIACYSFSIDFLKGKVKNLIVKKGNILWIKTSDYVKEKKSLYYKQD